MINASLVLVGQLLGTAFACGLNLYATLAVLGIVGRMGWVPDLPPGMRGLENGVVISLAIALYLVEFMADRVRYLDNVWEAAHTIIRPVAAGMLTAIAVQDAPWYLRAAAAVAAAGMALAAHGSKAGLRLILETRQARKQTGRRGIGRLTLSLTEDLAAVGLALAVILAPASAVIIVIASAVLLVTGGPILWRAAFFGLRAILARARGFFGRRGWRSRTQLSQALCRLVPIEPLGCSPLRAAPVTVTGLRGVGAYRNGWLIFTWEGPRFLYRSLFRSRCAELPLISDVTVRSGFFSDALDLRGGRAGSAHTFTMFLLKDGPSPHVTAAELTRGIDDGGHPAPL